MARLDVPGLGELQLGVLGQSESFRALPRLAFVGRALGGRAVDPVVRGGVQRPVARVADRVEDLPALELRPFDLPGRAIVIPAHEEEALLGSDEYNGAHAGKKVQRMGVEVEQ